VPGVPLQWSHGSEAVETLVVGRNRNRRDMASMEPRLGGRGNAGDAGGPLPHALRFNGATARRPWKRQIPRRCGVDGAASMEPRLGGRGNRRLTEEAKGYRAGFNGATARRPWKQNRRPRFASEFHTLQWSHGSEAVETRLGVERHSVYAR